MVIWFEGLIAYKSDCDLVNDLEKDAKLLNSNEVLTVVHMHACFKVFDLNSIHDAYVNVDSIKF